MPPHLDDDVSSYEQAHQSGLTAARQLSEVAPLSGRQRAWLSGFFAGMLADPHSAPQHSEPCSLDYSRPGDELTAQKAWPQALESPALPRAPKPVSDSSVTRLRTASEANSGTALDAAQPSPAAVLAQDAVDKDATLLHATGSVFHPAETTVHMRAALATAARRVKGASHALEEAPSKYSADNPFAARIIQLSPSQPRNASVWRMVLDVEGSGLRCRPGDQLGVVPSNDPDLVRKLLRRLGAKGQENVTTARGTGPAWRALLEEFSISNVTNQMLTLLSGTTRNPHEAATLEAMASSPEPLEATLPALLRRFPGAKPSLDAFVNALSPLLPQYFPLATSRSRHADALEALVVRAAHEARGVVHQLGAEKLTVGDWLPIFVDCRIEGHPPSESAAPAILLAPGAGTASAFAFLAERAATRGSGRNWLFTSPVLGEPTVPYADQFAAWQTSRVLTRLDVAASEDLGRRFLEQAEMVQAWIVDGSYVYVYADRATCTKLQAALAQLLMVRARISEEEAYARLSAMRASGQLRVVITQ